MEKKFIKVCESAISRYTRGGVLVGDYVEFVKGYKSHPEFKELHDNIKDAIDGPTGGVGSATILTPELLEYQTI